MECIYKDQCPLESCEMNAKGCLMPYSRYMQNHSIMNDMRDKIESAKLVIHPDVSSATFWKRIWKGMDPQEAATTPPHSVKKYEFLGSVYTMGEIAEMFNISAMQLRQKFYEHNHDMSIAVSLCDEV